MGRNVLSVTGKKLGDPQISWNAKLKAKAIIGKFSAKLEGVDIRIACEGFEEAWGSLARARKFFPISEARGHTS